MLINWFTVIAQVVNFLLLVWLLKRFLYGPILGAIDARETGIAAQLAEAESKQNEAQTERDDFQHKTEALEQQRGALLKKATDDANTEHERLDAKGNYSRIGIARVQFNTVGDPVGIERLGIASEPEADYERRADGSGGCEDPRITFVEPLHCYLMTYTALSPQGPHIALAHSEDLFHWQRLGLATFAPYHCIEFGGIANKDASLFPVAIPNPSGQLELAILHRPLFSGTCPEKTACHPSALPILKEKRK